jgi:hypothetical protein
MQRGQCIERLASRKCLPPVVICPEASSAQNSMAAVSADGSTVCVLMRRLNSSCSRSMALVVRADRHWLKPHVSIVRLSRCATARHLAALLEALLAYDCLVG